MDSDSHTAAASAGSESRPVLLCWTDPQSGEDVWLRLSAAQDFVTALEAQGFRRVAPSRVEDRARASFATAVA